VSPETIEQMNARAKTFSPDDQSYSAAVVRGLAIIHADWIRQSRARVGFRARWLDLFHDIDLILCPPMPMGLVAKRVGDQHIADALFNDRIMKSLPFHSRRTAAWTR